MTSLNFWIAFIAGISAILGAVVTVKPPQTTRYKILTVLAFVVLCIVGLVLIAIQSNQQAEAERASEVRHISEQAQLQQALGQAKQSLDQTRQEVATLQEQVEEIQAQATRPGNPSEKLDKIAEILGARIPATASTQRTVRGTAILTNGQVTVSNSAVTATAEIHASSQDDGVSGTLRVVNIKPGVSFDIVSTNLGDNGKVAWVVYP